LSEKLPAITAGQLRRALRKAGWIEMRQRGSHVRLEKDGVSITVADHGGSQIIPRGTLSALLKTAALPSEKLRQLL
jgi:predicted RNA binding protein YcfA (HicA-like mRNA interferase family)